MTSKYPGSLVIPIHSGNTSNEAVNDVTGLGGMTRTGRCYALGLMGVGQEKESEERIGTEVDETRK